MTNKIKINIPLDIKYYKKDFIYYETSNNENLLVCYLFYDNKIFETFVKENELSNTFIKSFDNLKKILLNENTNYNIKMKFGVVDFTNDIINISIEIVPNIYIIYKSVYLYFRDVTNK